VYVRNAYEIDPEGLEGFWGVVGTGLRRVGEFGVKAVTGVDIGGEPAPAAAPILSDRSGQETGMPIDDRSFLQKLRDRAIERLRADPAVREQVVATTARYASPELLAAAAARQARGAPDIMKASVILPVLAVGILLLRR
jgi:hypothetical protein